MVSPGRHRSWDFETSCERRPLVLAIMFVVTLGREAAAGPNLPGNSRLHRRCRWGQSQPSALRLTPQEICMEPPLKATAGTGTAYKLTHKSTGWALTPLYVFTITSNGVIPYSTLVIGRDGKLYGTTGFGGIGHACPIGHSGCGTVFSFAESRHILPHHIALGLKPRCTNSVEALMDRIPTAPLWSSIGRQSLRHHLRRRRWKLFGRLRRCFKLTPAGSGWTESTVYTFTGGADGAAPWAGVTLDQAGNLYGTTSAGGAFGGGTVYELSPSGSGWTKKILHSFQLSQTDGSNPYAGLIIDQSGNLYGATQYGGSAGGGTVFEMSPSGGSWNFTTLYSFAGRAAGTPKVRLPT